MKISPAWWPGPVRCRYRCRCRASLRGSVDPGRGVSSRDRVAGWAPYACRVCTTRPDLPGPHGGSGAKSPRCGDFVPSLSPTRSLERNAHTDELTLSKPQFARHLHGRSATAPHEASADESSRTAASTSSAVDPLAEHDIPRRADEHERHAVADALLVQLRRRDDRLGRRRRRRASSAGRRRPAAPRPARAGRRAAQAQRREQAERDRLAVAVARGSPSRSRSRGRSCGRGSAAGARRRRARRRPPRRSSCARSPARRARRPPRPPRRAPTASRRRSAPS